MDETLDTIAARRKQIDDLKAEQEKAIRRIYETKLATADELAKASGLTRQGVVYALRKLGVTIRPRGGNMTPRAKAKVTVDNGAGR